ncbi:hypothetical protein GXW82_14490 [Streptacidiphilus sp. 4-A2]|nr:hypothetical protein [Streptacidiphilus sp. 4-A2]
MVRGVPREPHWQDDGERSRTETTRTVTSSRTGKGNSGSSWSAGADANASASVRTPKAVEHLSNATYGPSAGGERGRTSGAESGLTAKTEHKTAKFGPGLGFSNTMDFSVVVTHRLRTVRQPAQGPRHSAAPRPGDGLGAGVADPSGGRSGTRRAAPHPRQRQRKRQRQRRRRRDRGPARAARRGHPAATVRPAHRRTPVAAATCLRPRPGGLRPVRRAARQRRHRPEHPARGAAPSSAGRARPPPRCSAPARAGWAARSAPARMRCCRRRCRTWPTGWSTPSSPTPG